MNFPSAKNATETDYCGIVSGGKVDKSKIFDTYYGKVRTAPLIREFPINMECELRHTLELGSHNLHVGEVMDVHVSEDCLTGGNPDNSKIDPMIFSGSDYCHIGAVISKAFSVGKEYDK